jgi:Flp pilus assembly protein TadG
MFRSNETRDGAKMAIKHLSDRLTRALQDFGGTESGNVLLTFALALVPMMGFVGAAVDYRRANSDKAAMQAAVDATALMLSKNAATMTSSQMNQNATNYFNSLFTRTDVTDIVVTPTYSTSDSGQLLLTALKVAASPTARSGRPTTTTPGTGAWSTAAPQTRQAS